MIMVSERGQLASRRQIQGPRGEPGWLEFINHMPVIANPADPSHCNSGRDGVELCTPAWYREGPEATWLAEGTLASQLEKKGTRQGKGSSSSIQIVTIGGPLRQSKVPTKSSSAGPRTRVGGMGLRAVVHADMLLPVPAPRIRAVGGGGGDVSWEGAVQHFPERRSSARICRIFVGAVCGGR